jgi:hypothetical protein
VSYSSSPNTLLSADISALASNLSAQMLSVPAGTLISLGDVEQWLQAYASINNTQPLSLPFVRPDFEGIKLQLQSKLAQLPSWQTLIQAGVGETILEFVATIGAYSQQAVMRAVQEAFPGSARLTSSIYSVTRLLGVHILRNTPASLTATLTYNNFMTDPTILIPSYSQFNVNGTPYFNRTAIVLNAGTPTASVTLYQGTVGVYSVSATGLPFQRYEVGNGNFAISDTDVVVYDDAYNQYTAFFGGIWNVAGAAQVFFTNTTPNGNVEVQFGNGIYGAQPELNRTLNIVYASTLGSAGDTSVTGVPITLQTLNTVVPDAVRSSSQSNTTSLMNRMLNGVTGTTTTQADNGGDSNSQDFYRVLCPHLYSAFNRMVTRPDYSAVGYTYPNLVDVYFQGQRELGRNNRNLINCVGVTALKADGTAMTNAEFAAFEDWLDERAIGKADYINIPPNAVPLKVQSSIYCEQGTDLVKTQSYIQYLLSNNYGIRQGVLGYSTYRSDIDAALRVRLFNMQVDYTETVEPTNDIIVGPTDWVQLQAPQLTMAYSTRTFMSVVGQGPNTALPQ